MSNKGIPDAWDDDYESVIDSAQHAPPHPSTPTPTRAQRKAQHAAANKALWDSADNPDAGGTHFFLQNNDVPLKSQAKPQVQVLSRKPKDAKNNKTPTLIQRPANGNQPNLPDAINTLNLQGQPAQDEDLDSEDEARIEEERKLKQRQEQARVERQEKLRRYDETRRRIFGDAEGGPDAPATAATAASASTSAKSTSNGTRSPNGRQRGGAPRCGGRGVSSSSSRPSSAGQSPARGAGAAHTHKQLFDPEYAPKLGSSSVWKAVGQTPSESQHIRQPRGPDGSGVGFVPRGRKSGIT